jgi:fibronectin type 3 domain-containing protein
MNINIDRPPLSFTSCLWVFLFSLASLTGCRDTHIAPASRLTSGKVTLSWNDVPGALSYNVYFSKSPGVTKWNGYKIRNATPPVEIIDLEPGKVYYFVVTVVDENGESGESREKSYTAADEPGSINFADLIAEKQASTARSPGDPPSVGQITLGWDDVPHAVSYNIYWSNTSGVTKLNGTKIANVMNPHTIKGLEAGKKYYFVVTAVTHSGESKESEEFSFALK